MRVRASGANTGASKSLLEQLIAQGTGKKKFSSPSLWQCGSYMKAERKKQT